MFCYQSPIERCGVRVKVGPDAMHQYVGDGCKCLALGYGVLTYSFVGDFVLHILAVPVAIEELSSNLVVLHFYLDLIKKPRLGTSVEQS